VCLVISVLLAERQKIKNGETALLKLKDWPSGEDFKAMMPARYLSLILEILKSVSTLVFSLHVVTQIPLHPSFFSPPDMKTY